MPRWPRVLLIVVLASALLATAADADDPNWPSFRGHRASGVAEGHATPTTWNVADSENILWKTAVPGLGHSSPVIWGDRLFVTTAVSDDADPYLKVGLYGNIAAVKGEAKTVQSFEVWCLDKNTGELLWKQTAHKGVPKVKRHTKSSHANPTPATDGKHLAVLFGSEGLYVYDLDGKLLWNKDLGVLDAAFFRVPTAQWGFGSSPVIHDGKVIVQADVIGDSFLAAFDVKTGKERWRTPRDDVPTWSTPTIHETGGRTEIIVNGMKQIAGYDFKTGKETWKLRGGGDIPVPTPIVAHGLAFITNAHGPAAPIWAIRTTARGDISLADGAASNEFVAWSTQRDGAYMQTPIVYGDILYVCRDNGALYAYDARTGKKLYQKRLGGGSSGFTASMVAADGKLYVTAETGDILVVRAGPEFELLATNSMDEIVMATPAISEGSIFFRTKRNVVAVAGRERGPATKGKE